MPHPPWMRQMGRAGALEGIAEKRPVGRETMFKQIGALAGATMLWLLSLASADSTGRPPAIVAQGASLIVFAVVLTVALPWHRFPEILKLGPPLIALLVGVRLRVLLDAGAGGDWAYVLMPVFWIGAFATWKEIRVSVFVLGLALLGEALVWPDRSTGWQDAAALLAVAGALGSATRSIFQRIRTRADRHPSLQATDALTGLPARRGWEERVPGLLEGAAAARQPVCAMVVHIDRLKSLGDERGWKDTDRVIRGTAAAWRDSLRKNDLMARLSGPDFATLLVGCSIEAAAGIARRLAMALERPLTCSLGIAEWNGEESAASLSRRADAAVERAKRSGGDRIEFARPEGRDAAKDPREARGSGSIASVTPSS